LVISFWFPFPTSSCQKGEGGVRKVFWSTR
jgi:hypothetical protein